MSESKMDKHERTKTLSIMRNGELKTYPYYNTWVDQIGGAFINKQDATCYGSKFRIQYIEHCESTDAETTYVYIAFNDSREPVAFLALVGDYRKEFGKCDTMKQCLEVFYVNRYSMIPGPQD